MNIVSGGARAARNAVGVLRDAGEGAWSWTNSKLRHQRRASGEAEAGLEVEPQITTKPESESTPSEVPPTRKVATKSPGKKAAAKAPAKKAAVEPAPSEVPPAKKAAAKTLAKPAQSAKGGAKATGAPPEW